MRNVPDLKMRKPSPRRLRIGLLIILAVVVVAGLAKLALSGQEVPDSRALVRAIFILLVAGGIPLAVWLFRGRR